LSFSHSRSWQLDDSAVLPEYDAGSQSFAIALCQGLLPKGANMPYPTVNLILDVVLVLAAIWMVITVRGLGGIVGRSLNLVTIGAVILGMAHLLSTILKRTTLLGESVNAPLESMVHRLVVLVGFIVLAVGFQQIRELKR
jgi:hypothetical protein